MQIYIVVNRIMFTTQPSTYYDIKRVDRQTSLPIDTQRLAVLEVDRSNPEGQDIKQLHRKTTSVQKRLEEAFLIDQPSTHLITLLIEKVNTWYCFKAIPTRVQSIDRGHLAIYPARVSTPSK